MGGSGSRPHAAALAAIVAVSVQVVGMRRANFDSPDELLPSARRASALTEEHRRRAEEAEKRMGEGGDRRAWKWAIRNRVWDHMELNNITMPPYPAHSRSPNFVGLEDAVRRVIELEEFSRARVVQVGPGTPLQWVREAVLDAGKVLLVPRARLHRGFFMKLDPAKIPPPKRRFAVTLRGCAIVGELLAEDESIRVDLVVVGTVAVSPSSGARVGRGVGIGDLAYAMLRQMRAIDEHTPVVTTVHDCQLADDIHIERMLGYDVFVDVICTPTHTIRTHSPWLRPAGIQWDSLSPEKLSAVGVLGSMKANLEAELGRQLPTAPSEVLPPVAFRRRGRGGRGRGRGHH